MAINRFDININIPNYRDIKVDITTESKSPLIINSDIKTKTATELIKYSVNEKDTLRVIKRYVEKGWISKLEFISSFLESIKKNYQDISELLINSSLDIISYKDKNYNTTLHLVASNNNIEIAQILIKSGINPIIKNKDGYTALSYAILNNNLDMARLLIDAGSNVNDNLSMWGVNQTLLEHTIKGNKTELAQLLIDSGANISFKNKDGYTPLHLCAIKDNLELFISLLERGGDPELKSECGNNCLHLAVLNNSQNIVYRILKYHNMDINKKNDKGCSPIRLTVDNFIYNLLIENGAYDEVKESLKKSMYQSKLIDRILSTLSSIMIICFSVSMIIEENGYTRGIDFFGALGLTCFVLLIIFSYSKSDWIMKFIDFKKV